MQLYSKFALLALFWLSLKPLERIYFFKSHHIIFIIHTIMSETFMIHCNTLKFQDKRILLTGQKSPLQHSLFWRHPNFSKLMRTMVWLNVSNFEPIKVRYLSVANKNALTAAFRLACLEIRSTIEEAINSTQNRIYSLKVFYFLLSTLSKSILFIYFWIDLVRVLAMTGNTSAVAGYTRI